MIVNIILSPTFGRRLLLVIAGCSREGMWVIHGANFLILYLVYMCFMLWLAASPMWNQLEENRALFRHWARHYYAIGSLHGSLQALYMWLPPCVPWFPGHTTVHSSVAFKNEEK